MRRERCAVFSCQGLGDGLLALILSNNLERQGMHTTTLHPFLFSLQSWFPHLPIRSFPPLEEMVSFLMGFDRYFFFYEKSAWMQPILLHCLKHHRERTVVLNPIATANRDYPFWEEARFDGTLTFVENLRRFCDEILKVGEATSDNGITPLSGFTHQKYPRRVVVHPTSSRPGKNWSAKKFAGLAEKLEKQGWQPVFLLTEEEKAKWPFPDLAIPKWTDLSDLAGYVYESGLMVGNDSGIGHLASCLGIPTVTICRSLMTARFWRPGWAPGIVLTPPSWIPNLKGLRWRDRYWQQWIPVSRVLQSCSSLAESLSGR